MVNTFSAAADLQLLDPFWRERAERTVLPNGLTLILPTGLLRWRRSRSG